MSGIEFIAGTAGIIHQNIDATIRDYLHQDAQTPGDAIKDLVTSKTPVLTGALISDYDLEITADHQADDIVIVYPHDDEQIAEWDRVYVQYVEGGTLGEATFTNPPREMFQTTADTDGLAFTEAWAQVRIQMALDACAAGSGLAIGEA